MTGTPSRSIPCPLCDAQAGQDCHVDGSKTTPHRPRIQAAITITRNANRKERL